MYVAINDVHLIFEKAGSVRYTQHDVRHTNERVNVVDNRTLGHRVASIEYSTLVESIIAGLVRSANRA